MKNLKELYTESCSKYKDNTAFHFFTQEGETATVSYEKFKTDIDALGTALLADMGLKGEKIALMGENSYRWCVSYFAVASGVGVVVPLDKETPAEELKNILSFADIKVVIGDKGAVKKIKENRYMFDEDLVIISMNDEEDTISFSYLLNEGAAFVSGGNKEFTDAQIDEDILAVLLFTSGTTGMAKGVMLSHRNLCSDLINVKRYVKIEETDVSLSVLPLHHTYEAIAFLMIIYSGAAISFARSVRHLKEDFRIFRPTVFVTVPLMLEKLHRKIIDDIERQGKRKKMQMLSVVSSAVSEEKKRKVFAAIHELFGGRLKKIVVGAAALHSEVASDFALFGIPVIIGYGLTECSPIVICNSLDDCTTDTIGKPLKQVEAKIADPDEKGIGEICVKGPMVMLGYYNNEEETAKVLVDGFLHTGDLGYKDKNGNYHITGRKKNVIVTRNGKNVYPEELEYYLSKHAVIADSMVYAHSDGIVTAQIIADEKEIKKKLGKENLDKSDIDKAVTEAVRSTNRKVPSYKNIKNVIIRNKDFIRTSTHKIKRGEQENIQN